MIWRKLYYTVLLLWNFFHYIQPFGNFFDQKLLQISVLDTPVNKSEVVVKLRNKQAFYCLITSRFVTIRKVVQKRVLDIWPYIEVPSMWFWSVSWSTNCPVYFSLFWSPAKKFVQSKGIFGQALNFLVNQISFWYTKISF